MNKPENVPIATLSGIASLTEIAAELPLPSSSLSNQIALLQTQQQQVEGKQLVSQPSNQAVLIGKLLETVNNAYLDFKNSSYNRATYIHDHPELPPLIRQIIQNKTDVFQPQFESYHGSPLKTNTISALAYSPSQRNAFRFQQQHMQQQYLQHQELQHQPLQQQQQHQILPPSPMLQGFSGTPSPHLQSPHMEQLLMSNNIPMHSPTVAYNNMLSPKIESPLPSIPTQERESSRTNQHAIMQNNNNNQASRLQHPLDIPQPVEQMPPPLIHHPELNSVYSPLQKQPQNVTAEEMDIYQQEVEKDDFTCQKPPPSLINSLGPGHTLKSQQKPPQKLLEATGEADKDQLDLLPPLKTRHQKTATIVGVMAESAEKTNQQISTIIGVVAETPEKVAEDENYQIDSVKKNLADIKSFDEPPPKDIGDSESLEQPSKVVLLEDEQQKTSKHRRHRRKSKEKRRKSRNSYIESDDIDNLKENFKCEPGSVEGLRVKYKLDKPIEQAEKIDKPVEQTEKIDKPVEQTEKIDKSVEQTEKIDKPIEQTEKIDKPVEQTEKPAEVVQNNEIEAPSKNNTLDNNEPKLQLKVPKLIVRKVKKVDGDKEVETLAIYSPDKATQYNITSADDIIIPPQQNIPEPAQKPPSVKSTSRRSRASSVSSQEEKRAKSPSVKKSSGSRSRGSSISSPEEKREKSPIETRSLRSTVETAKSVEDQPAKPPSIQRSSGRRSRTSSVGSMEQQPAKPPSVKRTPGRRTRASSVSSMEEQPVEPPPVNKTASRKSKDPSVCSHESELKTTRGSRKRKQIVMTVDSSSDDSDDEDYEEPTAAKKFKPSEENEVIDVKTSVRKFMYLMDKILDRELELGDGEIDINEDVEIPQEYLMPRSIISSLCTEIAKMKSSGMLVTIPTDQLVRLMAVMDRHVMDSLHLTISQNEDEEENKRWTSLQTERILRSAEAAVVILHITTTPEIPKQVLLEEAIDHVVSLCQFHLENSIYPEYDTIYKVAADLKNTSILSKSKRSRYSTGSKNKLLIQVYNKLCDTVSLTSSLIAAESLTDHIILKLSQIGISPFFVENVNVLQLEALKVARTIFRNYVKHRDLILDDILASLTRLPSTKRNLRNYRLREDKSIQMFTALVLQLIQCTVQIPKEEDEPLDNQKSLVDRDVLIVKSYEDSLRAAQNFMSIFLKKCSSKDENDFRPMFENFLHDLFVVVNFPEWPAAEVLLTQLGRLFVVTFSNTKLDMSLRSSALDYLSQIATHLRRSALKSQSEEEQEKLKIIVEKVINRKEGDDIPVVEDMEIYEDTLRKELLIFLNSSSDGEDFLKYAREFYLGQWLRDVQMEIDKSLIAPMMSIPGAATKSKGGEEEKTKEEISDEKLQILREKKEYFHSLIKGNKIYSNLKIEYQLDYDSACRVVDYLASSRSFSRSFDLYMQQIFKMLNEQAIGLRTKAVKALTMIVSVDPSILAREDVQTSVRSRFHDPSTNVREAAVDLIGQFILKCPDLIKQYYDMIIDRILDTGISVRKRVIKILRDICLEHPDFEKIPEICLKMIRRVDDEIGIKKLVTEVFRSMWFNPVPDVNKCAEDLYIKAVNITKVVSLNKDTGFDWLESLLKNILDSENQSLNASTKLACQQLVDCLFTRLVKPELNTETSTIVSCLITLYIFCKSYPKLLVVHATTLQPYLSSKVSSAGDSVIINYVSKILELVVPLMEHPNPKFLAELEEDAMKLMLKQSQNVVQSCASCLAAIVNRVTENYKFIIDGFLQFFKFLQFYKNEHEKKPDNPALRPKRPTLLRALFTIGLFVRYFDLDKHISQEQLQQHLKKLQQLSGKGTEKGASTSEQVFNLCMYFTDFDNEEITLKAILAIGFIGIRYPQYLLQGSCLALYQEILSPKALSTKAKFIVMKSLQNHLMEDENRMQQAETIEVTETKKSRKKQEESPSKGTDIKEMGDSASSTTSELIQILLKDIMNCFLTAEKQVRISALQVICIILRQGLIHPAQCIPYLVAISTDNERLCHVKAEQCLNDIDGRYQGFIHMKALQGVKMAYEVQKVIQKSDGGYLCGYRERESKISLIYHVYSLLRSNKQYRRPFLLSLLKLIEDKRSKMDSVYFMAENVAYLNYNIQEEVLFVIHHVDTTVSVSGVAILQKFRELFHPTRREANKQIKDDYDSDDSEDDEANLEAEVDSKELWEVASISFGCMLLLELKKYLKTTYGMTDSKCQKYSPSEPSKIYDKVLVRKVESDFISEYKDLMFSKEREHKNVVEYYSHFKHLIMALDTEDLSDSELDKSASNPKESQGNHINGEAYDDDEEENIPNAEDQVAEREEKKPEASSSKNTEDEPIQLNEVIPKSLNLGALNGLKIDIPIIPIKMVDVAPRKAKRKKAPPSRRSSRSSHGAPSCCDSD